MGNRPQISTTDVAPTLSADIDANSSIQSSDVEKPDIALAINTDINDPVTNKYIKDLGFMEEVVEFVVGKTRDKNDPDPIIAGVNGIMRVIKLGEPQKLPRKFLNVLINTVVDVTTHEYVDEDGLKQTRMQTQGMPSLQIQILNDPSGVKGMQWFAAAQHGRL